MESDALRLALLPAAGVGQDGINDRDVVGPLTGLRDRQGEFALRLAGQVHHPADAGRAPAAIWAIGPLRKGELWESTAIPEIRQQAADLAHDVVAALPSPELVRRARERMKLGLAPPREIYLAPHRDRIDWGEFPDWARPSDPEAFGGNPHEG